MRIRGAWVVHVNDLCNTTCTHAQVVSIKNIDEFLKIWYNLMNAMKLVKRTVLPISHNIAFKNMQYNTINRGMTAILMRSQIVCIVLNSGEQNDIYTYIGNVDKSTSAYGFNVCALFV